MNKDYRNEYEEWLSYDLLTKKQLLEIKDKKEIEDRFYKELSFGTGGIRGKMGAGTNRMNRYTVQKASMGLAKLITEENPIDPKIAIAYDTRNDSFEFAKESARVFNNYNIQTYLFCETTPTPILSYAVRRLGCDAGIVITASHNPKEYNGFKVYDSLGGQITPSYAKRVASNIRLSDSYLSDSIFPNNQNIRWVGNEILSQYCTEIRKLSTFKGELNIVFTPLHGSGNVPIQQILSDYNVHVVMEEELPNGDFPTVKYPNPEHRDALFLAIKYAKKLQADLVLGTDPDCDRIGVAVRYEHDYTLLTGNQVGALLTDYLLSSRPIKYQTTVIKTIVTNDLGAKIASQRGAQVIETLTGFKYIGEKINEFENDGNQSNEFLIGYEESYGYLIGTHARDKDGVVSAMLISEMAAFYKEKGKTLVDRLGELYDEYGFYLDDLDSLVFEGKEGKERILNIMNQIREGKSCFLEETLLVKDYSLGLDSLPKENLIKIIMKDDSWIAVRPSGTEPKIKFYYSICARNKNEAEQKLQTIKSEIENYLKIKFDQE